MKSASADAEALFFRKDNPLSLNFLYARISWQDLARHYGGRDCHARYVPALM